MVSRPINERKNNARHKPILERGRDQRPRQGNPGDEFPSRTRRPTPHPAERKDHRSMNNPSKEKEAGKENLPPTPPIREKGEEIESERLRKERTRTREKGVAK